MLFLVCTFAACTFHLPWDVLGDYDGVRVVLRVVPDDADVLLNGRYIGAAYEYASSRMALRLASRENELVLRKKGFREQVVDLSDYPTRSITLRVTLEAEEPLPPAAAVPESPPAAGEEPAAKDDPAYVAKSEPLPPLPAEAPPAPAESFLSQVTLRVTPEEAAIYIDGKFWALAPAEGQDIFLRLPPGKYAVAAFKPGFKPFGKEIVVPRQEKFTLTIALEK